MAFTLQYILVLKKIHKLISLDTTYRGRVSISVSKCEST